MHKAGGSLSIVGNPKTKKGLASAKAGGPLSQYSAQGKPKSFKEGYHNWRQDLIEVMDDIEDNKEVKEKKVNNKIKINPELGEALKNLVELFLNS